MAVQNWALISLALANLSHPAQVSMKDHESLQTTSYIKLHQVIIQVSEELNRPNHSPRSPRARGSGSCESGASTNKAGPSYFSGLGTTPLGIKPLVGHLRCHDILLTEFMLYPPGNLTAKSIKVQECNSFYSNFTPEWRNSEDKKMGDLASHLSIALQCCGVAFVPKRDWDKPMLQFYKNNATMLCLVAILYISVCIQVYIYIYSKL